jgi:hypothetical protein
MTKDAEVVKEGESKEMTFKLRQREPNLEKRRSLSDRRLHFRFKKAVGAP